MALAAPADAQERIGATSGRQGGLFSDGTFTNAHLVRYPLGGDSWLFLFNGNSRIRHEGLRAYLEGYVAQECPLGSILETREFSETYFVISGRKPRLMAIVYCGDISQVEGIDHVPLSQYGLRDASAILPSGELVTVALKTPTLGLQPAAPMVDAGASSSVWRCDCSVRLRECQANVRVQASAIDIAVNTTQCAIVGYTVNSQPQTSVVTEGRLLEEWLGGAISGLEVNDCYVCRDDRN
jgi:hypothetical protein